MERKNIQKKLLRSAITQKQQDLHFLKRLLELVYGDKKAFPRDLL